MQAGWRTVTEGELGSGETSITRVAAGIGADQASTIPPPLGAVRAFTMRSGL